MRAWNILMFSVPRDILDFSLLILLFIISFSLLSPLFFPLFFWFLKFLLANLGNLVDFSIPLIITLHFQARIFYFLFYKNKITLPHLLLEALFSQCFPHCPFPEYSSTLRSLGCHISPHLSQKLMPNIEFGQNK